MNNQLPINDSLSIQRLAGVFNNTTNSYKYFWLLAMLNRIAKDNRKKIKFSELVYEIIALVWYPINYFNISFGKQDTLFNKIFLLKQELKLPVNVNRNELLNRINENQNNATVITIVNDITRYVPFRFLTTWFDEQLRGINDSSKNMRIVSLSNSDLKDKPLYRIDSVNNSIEISNEWYEYLFANIRIIKDFTYWNLLQYLEKKNPNVPNISQKLFEPTVRNLKIAKGFWKLAINEIVNFKCIYSNKIIHANDFTVDHYIPWSFVAHDELWNLIPTTNQINSAKSNSVPSFRYFEKFAEMQFEATKIILAKYKSKNLLEDYLLLFRLDINDLSSLSQAEFRNKLKETINPLAQIASNNGFSSNWVYS